MASSSFNYQQLNLVARDAEAVAEIQKYLITKLETYRDNLSPTSQAFKNVVNTANEVWAGADKDAFIKNLTASATSSSETLNVLITNVKKYLPADLSSFNTLQQQTTKIASTKY